MKDAQANSQSKLKAAIEAVGRVHSKMRVGLGTGSTAAFAIAELGRRVKEEGLVIECCATSFSSLMLATQAGLDIRPVESFDHLDLSIDGADEVDQNLRLIKGGGAAHTREKIVHALSSNFLCVVDRSKLVDQLGGFRVPVEFLPVSIRLVESELARLGASDCSLRMAVKKDGPVITDNGNLVFDVKFESLDAELLESEINQIPGVVENGIFAKYRPHEVIIGDVELSFLKR